MIPRSQTTRNRGGEPRSIGRKIDFPPYISEPKPICFQPCQFRVHDVSHRFALDVIKSAFTWKRTKRPQQEQALEALICALHHARDHGRPLAVHMTKSAYTRTKATARYWPRYYTYNYIRHAVLELERLGYIIRQRGYRDENTGTGHLTKLFVTPALEDLFPIEFTATPHELIVLRVNLDENRKKGRRKQTKNIAYTDNAYTKSKRHWLTERNAFMRDFECTIDGRRINSDLYSVHSRGDWNAHGRFYDLPGGYMSLPKTQRDRILINGQRTDEPDFPAHHITLAYMLEGLPVHDNPYEFVAEHLGVCPEDFRPAIKAVINMALNAESDTETIRAFNKKQYLARRNRYNCKKRLKALKLAHAMYRAELTPQAILQAARNMHAPIAHYFGADKGIELMHHDSEIMRNILSELMAENNPALPVHDSIRVMTKDTDPVWQLMRKHRAAYVAEYRRQAELSLRPVLAS